MEFSANCLPFLWVHKKKKFAIHLHPILAVYLWYTSEKKDTSDGAHTPSIAIGETLVQPTSYYACAPHTQAHLPQLSVHVF